MGSNRTRIAATLLVLVTGILGSAAQTKSPWTLVGYNNLGMHCMDSDYSVFSVLPPYNTIHAQLTDASGLLVKDPAARGITVTYQAVADPQGSLNATSVGKSNFWTFAQALYGAALGTDQGLKGNPMPGAATKPMTWDGAQNWWIAEGIPITPRDDTGAKNAYPMFRLVARDANNAVLATTDIVLPVSDEMDCRACHASGAGPAARPARGWAWNASDEKDFRLNILLRHDDHFAATPTYRSAAAAVGYSTAGLYPTVATYGQPVLCAACHASEALGTASQPGVEPLTAAIHGLHASVIDPTNGQTLESATNRTACYRCHPGAATKCLRGAMGKAVAGDGTMAMQCQSCHGAMSKVAGPRTGWLEEPTCQQCHSGTATHNNGQIRYTSVFDGTGAPRQAVDATFATDANAPMAPYSLYRFSHGHGGVACESCHGSTHAEYPSSHASDNVQSTAIQGHDGVLIECNACHGTQPATTSGGPHGMHPVGQTWVSRHPDAANGQQATCQPCHGSDYRGTVLSRTKASRTLATNWGTKAFFKGAQVSCYACHNGAFSETGTTNRAPVAANGSATTSSGNPVSTTLTATDADGNALTYRIVGQPQHGTVALAGRLATYYPEAGYAGTDSYTFAAWDNAIDSNLGTIAVNVAPSTCALTCSAVVPTSATVGALVPFAGTSSAPGCTGSVTYDWDFGDGSAHSAAPNPAHAYGTNDSFAWTMTVTAGHATCVQAGTLRVTGAKPTGVPSLLDEVRIARAAGTDATITWDAANCPAPSYELVYGFGSGLATATAAGAQCAIGSTGRYVWPSVPDPRSDASRLLWFVVVGTDGATVEGSWGTTSAGKERHGSDPNGFCAITKKDLTAACAAP